MKGEDYHGADLVKGGVRASSPSDCCAKCRANSKCLYWTYGTRGSKKGTCWLKSSETGRQMQGNRDAGRVCRKAPSPPADDEVRR